MSNVSPALSVKEFGCRRGGSWLFTNLDFTLQAGHCWVLTGPNGCGKTTLLRSLAGLFADYEGSVARAPSAYLGHKAGVPRLLSVWDGLSWYQRLLGNSADLHWLLDRVGLTGYEGVPASELSAGQLRRLALARLQLQSVGLWLLDEPYTALDATGQRLVDELIQAQCEGGGAVLAATHQPLGIGEPDSTQNLVIHGSMHLQRLTLDA